MAKSARRSVTSNPSTLTKSASYSGNYSATNSSGDSSSQKTSSSASSNTSLPPVTLDPLRATAAYHQFTTRPTISNYNSSRHDSRTTVRPFKNSSGTTSRSDSENINISNNSTNSTSSQQEFNSTTATANRLAAERERIRMEFYATYDVMTGVRIAATLGGFFGLMVFLIVYKSRSHSNETLKVLKDPKMAAVAAACMQEEEEREIQEALEATGLSLYPDDYDDMFFRRQRMFSLGNVSAPPVLNRNFRFSSVGGGYSSLLEPPRRFSLSSGGRRKSISESSRVLSAYPMGSSFGTDDYFIETDDELDNEFDGLSTREDESLAGKQHRLLEVPITGQESRRSSAMTCCSTESSYLERRCSAVTLGLSSFQQKMPTEDASHRRSSTDLWDYYYPDIQIINPTPKASPCPSERDLRERLPLGGPSVQSTNLVLSSTAAAAAIDRSSDTCSSYYNQYTSRKYLRKASYNNSDSIEEDPAEMTDQISICTESHDDNNELKQVVRRSTSNPMNNNNNNQIHTGPGNNTNSYPNAVQFQRQNGGIDSCSSRRAPLASLSSFKISSVDYQDSDLHSLGSDSVFVESYADTDDDMEQFSTDSDEISISLGNDYPTTTTKKCVEEHEMLQLHEADPTKKHYSHKMDTSHKIDSNKKLSTSSSKRNRPTLERHRTISSISNDRIMLISQQSQELPMHEIEGYVNVTCPSSIGTVADLMPSSLQTLTITPDLTLSSSPLTTATINTPKGPTAQHVVVDLQMPTTSFSYDNNNDGNKKIISDSSFSSINRIRETVTLVMDETSHDHKSKSSYSSNSNCENVEVNVIIENRPTTTTTISPSVILELPVIALTASQANDDDDDDDADDPPRDPSLPGTSRKWSKETLF